MTREDYNQFEQDVPLSFVDKDRAAAWEQRNLPTFQQHEIKLIFS